MSKFDINLVDTAKISINGDSSLNDRYSLKIPLKPNTTGKTAIVILKNPASSGKAALFFKNISIGDVYDVDKTTTHITKLIFSQSTYNQIITVNLFPYYDNIPAAINSIYSGMAQQHQNLSMSNNIAEIERVLKTPNSDVFCAWGQANGIHKDIYKNTIKEILDLICSYHPNDVFECPGGNTINITSKNSDYCPPHASTW